jgi:hypothetical protein
VQVLAAADEVVFESLRKGFQEPNYGPFVIILVLLMVVLLAIIAVFFTMRYRQEQRESLDDSRQLFEELIRAHQLSSVSRRHLLDMAEAIPLKRADLLFVREDFFEKGASALVDRTPRLSEELVQLRRMLFSDVQPPEMAGMK